MFSVSFIMNVSTHLMRDLIPHQVGGDALIRWSPSCGGWGPNSLQVLTKTPFIIVYQAYDYNDMIISCKALQWAPHKPHPTRKSELESISGLDWKVLVEVQTNTDQFCSLCKACSESEIYTVLIGE